MMRSPEFVASIHIVLAVSTGMQHPAFGSCQLHKTKRHHKHHLPQKQRDKTSNLENMASANRKQIKRPEVLSGPMICLQVSVVGPPSET